MKRTLSLLLVLVMVVTMVPAVFAATDKSDIDFDDIYYVDSYTPIEAEIAANAEETFIWAATEAGKLTYEVPANVTVTLTQGEQTATGTGTVSLTIVAGEEVSITIANAANEAAAVTLTGTLTQEEPEVPKELTVTLHPVSPGQVYPNTEMVFKVKAEGGVGNLTYQWQKSKNGGQSWMWTSTYGEEGNFVASRWSYYDYRCCITDEAKNRVYTEMVSWERIYGTVEWLDEPEDIKGALNVSGVGTDTVSFTAKAVTDCGGTLKYRWEKWDEAEQIYKQSASLTNSAVVSENGSTLSYEAKSWNPHRVRCVAYDEHGCSLYGRGAVLTRRTKLLTVVDPETVYVQSANDTATFAVKVTSSQGAVTYQWEKSKDGVTWSGMSNASGATYSVAAKSWNQMFYRCKIKDDIGVWYYTQPVTFEYAS